MPDGPALPQTALRHFAAQLDEVRNMAMRDPSFVDMCEELCAAEEALARIDTLPVDLRNERRTECRGWIERLIREMEEALFAGKVIPLRLPVQGTRPP